MSRPSRRLALPADWASTGGLWLDANGLEGSVFDKRASLVMLFAGVRVICVDVTGWSVADIVTCLICHEVPRNAKPRLEWLSDSYLAPLVACGSLSGIERLRVLSHVPGWQP